MYGSLHLKIGMAIFGATLAVGVQAASVGDDFEPAEGLAWGNESGNWDASGGNYGPGFPNNFPNAYSGLPYNVTEFDLNVDIDNLGDGGIWVHSEHTNTGTIGVRGILLVTRSNQLYWHDVVGDSSYGSSLALVGHSGFTNVRVTATDNGGSYLYEAFLDGSSTAAATYASSSFSNGRVALYSFSGQRFDDFELSASDEEIAPIPIPAAAWLFVPAIGGLLSRRRRDHA